jgi:hypothetical protein
MLETSHRARASSPQKQLDSSIALPQGQLNLPSAHFRQHLLTVSSRDRALLCNFRSDSSLESAGDFLLITFLQNRNTPCLTSFLQVLRKIGRLEAAGIDFVA